MLRGIVGLLNNPTLRSFNNPAIRQRPHRTAEQPAGARCGGDQRWIAQHPWVRVAVTPRWVARQPRSPGGGEPALGRAATSGSWWWRPGAGPLGHLGVRVVATLRWVARKPRGSGGGNAALGRSATSEAWWWRAGAGSLSNLGGLVVASRRWIARRPRSSSDGDLALGRSAASSSGGGDPGAGPLSNLRSRWRRPALVAPLNDPGCLWRQPTLDCSTIRRSACRIVQRSNDPAIQVLDC